MRKMSSWGHSGRGEEGLVVVAARDEQSEYHSTSVRFYPPTNETQCFVQHAIKMVGKHPSNTISDA